MSHQALIDFYQTLTPQTLPRFAEFYSEDAWFKDPFNEDRRGARPHGPAQPLQPPRPGSNPPHRRGPTRPHRHAPASVGFARRTT